MTYNVFSGTLNLTLLYSTLWTWNSIEYWLLVVVEMEMFMHDASSTSTMLQLLCSLVTIVTGVLAHSVSVYHEVYVCEWRRFCHDCCEVKMPTISRRQTDLLKTSSNRLHCYHCNCSFHHTCLSVCLDNTSLHLIPIAITMILSPFPIPTSTILHACYVNSVIRVVTYISKNRFIWFSATITSGERLCQWLSNSTVNEIT